MGGTIQISCLLWIYVGTRGTAEYFYAKFTKLVQQRAFPPNRGAKFGKSSFKIDIIGDKLNDIVPHLKQFGWENSLP
ncbi:hypothetical protein I4100191B2_14630 [Clostridiales bacterium]